MPHLAGNLILDIHLFPVDQGAAGQFPTLDADPEKTPLRQVEGPICLLHWRPAGVDTASNIPATADAERPRVTAPNIKARRVISPLRKIGTGSGGAHRARHRAHRGTGLLGS